MKWVKERDGWQIREMFQAAEKATTRARGRRQEREEGEGGRKEGESEYAMGLAVAVAGSSSGFGNGQAQVSADGKCCRGERREGCELVGTGKHGSMEAWKRGPNFSGKPWGWMHLPLVSARP
jgi:hypothetical protein